VNCLSTARRTQKTQEIDINAPGTKFPGFKENRRNIIARVRAGWHHKDFTLISRRALTR